MYSDDSEKPFFELKDLELKPSTSKYFVCNKCNEWNLVNDIQIHDARLHTSKKRKDVHMILDEDLYVVVKKFAANFGGYQPMLVFLLNEFYKSRANK